MASAPLDFSSRTSKWYLGPPPPCVTMLVPTAPLAIENSHFGVGYLTRKALPIKRNDAEPLTRDDVQYDLLDYIFSDSRAVFTNPYSSDSCAKITFCELYINALAHSNKCS